MRPVTHAVVVERVTFPNRFIPMQERRLRCPCGFGKLHVRLRLRLRIHWDQVIFLPLEQIRDREIILPVSAKLYRPLQALKCARV